MTEKEKLVALAVSDSTPAARVKAALRAIECENGDVAYEPEKFMSVKDAMVFLGGISRPHLWFCYSKKGLPSHMVGGRRVFSRKELSDWVLKGSKA